jgi:hypothetical protein
MLAAMDERLTILKMIDEHKITADQGAQLLSAMEKPASNEPSDQFLKDKGDKSSGRARVFRVLITDTQTGKTRTSVTLPLSLVKWGLKVGTQYSREINGIDFDEISDILASGAEGKIIEVIDEEDGEHVQIFVD